MSIRTFRIIALILVCMGFYACTAVSRPVGSVGLPDDFDTNMAPVWYHAEAVKKYLVDHNPREAATLLEAAVRADADYAPAYYLLAKLLLDNGSPDSAALYAAKANRLDSANITYKSQLAAALLMSEQYDDALQLYSELVSQEPYNPLNYRLLAALYDYKGQHFTAISVLDTAEMRLGRIEELSTMKRELLFGVRLYEKALEESRKLVEEYPYDDENYRVLGDIYNAMGRDSLALLNYGEALRIDSTNAVTLFSLASFYRQRNDNRNYIAQLRRIFDNPDVSLEYKKRVFGDLTSNTDFYRNNYFSLNLLISTLVTLYPDDYSVVDMYATHTVRGGETEQGLNLYKSFIQLQPQTLDAYRNIIIIETHLMRPDSVAKYSDMALEYFPESVDIMLDKSYAQMKMERYDEAVATMQTASRNAVGDSVRIAVVGILGDMYRLAGDDRAALRCYRKAARLSSDPLDKSVFAGLAADTYHEQGKLQRAFRFYNRALKLNPDNAGVLNNFAYYLAIEGRDLERALEMSERANRLVGNSSTFLDTQGWILYKLGRLDEAKTIMQRAVSFDMDSAETLFHYAEILYALGDSFMARVYWQRALESGYDADVINQRLELTTNK